MKETRVERYKEYRQSFIKEGSIVGENSDSVDNFNIATTTSTLPMDKVIDAVQLEQKEHDTSKKIKRRHILFVSLVTTFVILCVVGLIILGILAWR